MTPTPRTAAAEILWNDAGLFVVPADFARQLERENQTFRAAQKACEDCDAPRDAMTTTPTPRTDERANNWESTDGQWVNADFARQLERELAAELEQLAANHEATRLMGKWLEVERELADRLAALIKRDRDGYGGQVVDPECDCCDCEYLAPIDKALAAWKEARSGTV